MYKCGKNQNYTRWCIEHDLKVLADWFKANKLTLNLNKTVAMKFRKNKPKAQLQISDYVIPWVDKTKFLGLWLDSDLTWKIHIENLCLHLKRNMYLLRNPKNIFDKSTLKMIYHAHIQSHVLYGLVLWGNSANKFYLNKVSSLLNECVRTVASSRNASNSYTMLKILPLKELIVLQNYKFSYKVIHHLLPKKNLEVVMTDKKSVKLTKTHPYNTRNKGIPNLLASSKSSYNKSFLLRGINAICSVPHSYRDLKFPQFVRKCKLHLNSQDSFTTSSNDCPP